MWNSASEISKHTGLARNTVTKYLRSEETEPTYTRRTSPSKLDPYAEKLATWVGIKATKSQKQRRNLKQIYTSGRPVHTASHSKNVHSLAPALGLCLNKFATKEVNMADMKALQDALNANQEIKQKFISNPGKVLADYGVKLDQAQLNTLEKHVKTQLGGGANTNAISVGITVGN